MKLHRITLRNFKGVTQRSLDFPEVGTTVVVGHNETGKSSLILAVDLLLETLHTSKKTEVKAAQPLGQDLGVEVEADLSVAADRFVYRKRWLKDPLAELTFICGPRTGQSLTGREAHEAVKDLLEHADTALWQALRILQTGARSGDFSGSAALRRALDAGGFTPHDDASAVSVLEAARLERNRYFTDTGRERDELKKLRARHQQAVEQHRHAQDALAQITQAVEHYDRCLSETRAAKRALDQATENLAVAQTAEQEITALRAQYLDLRQHVEQAQLRVDKSTADRQARQGLITDLESASRAYTDLEQDVEQHRSTASDQHQHLERVREKRDHARSQEHQARRVVNECQATLRRAEDRRRLVELDTVIDQLDQLQQQAAHVATYRPSGITADQLRDLETAQRDLELARSQLDAGSAHVTVTALDRDLQVHIDGAPAAVEPDSPWHQAVTEPVTIVLPHRLQVSVEPEGGLQQRKANVRSAEDHLATLLVQAGVDSLPEARQAVAADQRYAQDSEAIAQHKNLVLRGQQESSLRQEHAALTIAVKEHEMSADTERTPEQLRQALAQAEEKLETAQHVLAACEKALQQAEHDDHQAHVELTQTQARWEAAKLSQQEAHTRLAQAREKIPDAELDTNHASLTSTHAHLLTELHTLDADWSRRDADGILLRAQAQRQHVESAHSTLDAARSAQSRAEGTLDGMNQDVIRRQYDQSLTQVQVCATELAAGLRQAAAAKLLVQTLEKFQAEAHRKYVAPFRERLKLLGRTVYGPTFDVDLRDDLTIARRGLHGTWLDVGALSTGAQEQLDVLIRLAVASLVDPQDGTPVIFDDTLGHSDPHRLSGVAAAVDSVSSKAQVIILTATPERFATLSTARVVRIQDL